MGAAAASRRARGAVPREGTGGRHRAPGRRRVRPEIGDPKPVVRGATRASASLAQRLKLRSGSGVGSEVGLREGSGSAGCGGSGSEGVADEDGGAVNHSGAVRTAACAARGPARPSSSDPQWQGGSSTRSVSPCGRRPASRRDHNRPAPRTHSMESLACCQASRVVSVAPSRVRREMPLACSQLRISSGSAWSNERPSLDAEASVT